MRSRLGAGFALLVLALPSTAAAVSCRGYPESTRAEIKGRVETLRMLEREAADRLIGLDTRTFPFLAAEARKAADAIATPFDLAQEDELKRCRNLVDPVRGICRGAALALAEVLDRHEAGTAETDARRSYARSMPRCEGFMRLSPLATAIRTID